MVPKKFLDLLMFCVCLAALLFLHISTVGQIALVIAAAVAYIQFTAG